MELFISICWFILGCCFGSFFHVVGYRLPRGENILVPKRSYCPSCNHHLDGKDLIPIFSFISTGGKCRYCKDKISIFYPMIELITGLLFAVSFYRFGYTYEFFVSIVLSSLLSIVLVSDISYLVIPDSVTFISSFLIFILQLIFLGWKVALTSIFSGIVMFIIMYLIMLLGNFIFKKESLGGADIKLMFLSGLTVGKFASLCVIFVSSFVALPVSIFLYFSKKERMIPYGPFLVVSILLLFFFSIDVSTILEFFENLY